ncbi:hypothetical protein LSTR_LSTR016215 [Laodelphax striatellus]|uniref:Uncharacterized protein n=1 Tax=Laodelphax striatellus TaxID=195883 RepID=A0A482X8D5_LAOST|nr:hypothetical protein LSTR_LSTR016215 [Laodelphax striatellus]
MTLFKIDAKGSAGRPVCAHTEWRGCRGARQMHEVPRSKLKALGHDVINKEAEGLSHCRGQEGFAVLFIMRPNQTLPARAPILGIGARNLSITILTIIL